MLKWDFGLGSETVEGLRLCRAEGQRFRIDHAGVNVVFEMPRLNKDRNVLVMLSHRYLWKSEIEQMPCGYCWRLRIAANILPMQCLHTCNIAREK